MDIAHLLARAGVLLALSLPLQACSQEQGTETAATDAGQGDDGNPEELNAAGTIELRHYTVAYVGSGTVGGGTLTVDGVEHPFRIAGLGVAGIGASALDATGTV